MCFCHGLKMCIWFWGYPPLFFINFFLFYYLIFFFSGQITIRIDTLRVQLFLEFSTHHFETRHTCSTWCVDVLVALGLSSHFFLINFFYFFNMFFPDSITIRIDTLWVQLLVGFSIDHFESMRTCSTFSEDVHVVLGLSSNLFFINFFHLVYSSFLSCGRNSS